MIHHTSTDTQPRRRCLLLQAGKTQAYGSHPHGERDDRLGDSLHIPGILVQPAFQTLTRGITQMLHDLLGRHTSGEIQLHGTTTLLLTEHRILSFNLQENVRSPLPGIGTLSHRLKDLFMVLPDDFRRLVQGLTIHYVNQRLSNQPPYVETNFNEDLEGLS